MKRVYPKKDVCIGCQLCRVACLTAHSKSGDVVIAHKEEEGLRPRNDVFAQGATCLALSCRHCPEPACVAACISGAMYKDPVSGRTEYDEERCVGCWSCIMACPYGAIWRHPEGKKVVKCDLCKDRESPACVQACPNAALVFEER